MFTAPVRRRPFLPPRRRTAKPAQNGQKDTGDRRGFILTGPDLPAGTRWPRGRPPLPLETSLPGVFAAGDVRHGSVNRVASAVGEGAATIPLVHRYLARPLARSGPGTPRPAHPRSADQRQVRNRVLQLSAGQHACDLGGHRRHLLLIPVDRSGAAPGGRSRKATTPRKRRRPWESCGRQLGKGNRGAR